MVDRTHEFSSTVQVLAKEAGNVARRPLPPRADTTLLNASKQVAAALRVMSGLVQRLADLAKRKSLFDDPTTEINELTGLINSNVQTQTASIKNIVNAVTSGAYGAQSKDHWMQVAEVLRAHLVANTRHFQEAVRTTAENMKVKSKRKQRYQHSRHTPLVQLDSPLFSAPAPQPAPPPGPQAGAPVAPPQSAPLHPAGGIAGDAGLRRRAAAPAEPPAAGAGAGLPPTVSYAPKFPTGGVAARQVAQMHAGRRNTEVRKYEQMVSEIGRMFTQMANLVALQGEAVERIDRDIEGAHEHIKGGETELFKYFKSVTADRNFVIKVFIVLVVMIVLFALLN